MFELRSNQIEPVRKGIEFFRKGRKPSIIVMPTAAGKSWIIAAILKETSGKTVIIQPSKELLEQNYDKFTALGGHASIYSASFNTKEYGEVTYATIGSIKALGKEFKELGYTNLIVDEVHMYPRGADSMFGKFMLDSEIKSVLGLTATPFKLQTNSFNMQSYSILSMLTSRSKKGSFFKEIIHIGQIQDIIKEGYWSKLEYQVYDFDSGGLIYNSTKADYTEASIIRAYENQGVEDQIVQKLEEVIDRKSILVFVPSISQAEALVDRVPKSACVSSLTPKKERDTIIQAFRNQELRVIFNVNILSVGFDYPQIDCIISGRPTASLAWWYQVVGRGTRIHPEKENCLIVDFVGNIEKFGKIEYLYYKRMGQVWKLYGEEGRLLTGIAIDQIGTQTEESDLKVLKGKEIEKSQRQALSTERLISFGKYQGKKVSELPEYYRKWMLNKFEFSDKNKWIKEELLKLQNQ